MKGAIKPDHMPVNKYELLIAGGPSITFTEITGLEEEIQSTDLPDRTKASGGDSGPSEMEVKVPLHHAAEILFMEAWLREGKDPVLPTYKKAATLIFRSISGLASKTFPLIGVWNMKRVTPDLEMANEGEMATATYTLSVDQILPPV